MTFCSRMAMVAVALVVVSKATYGTGCPVVIHRLAFSALDAELVSSLPIGVAVVAAPQANVHDLALAYQSALGKSTPFPGKEKRSLVAAGPALDSPDELRIGECKVEGGRITLRIVHTAHVMRGGGLRRNIPYRPLIELPMPSEPGRYIVEVHWQAVESLPDGKPLAPPVIVGPVSFTF